MYINKKIIMEYKNQGLTVGELTIAVGILIIIGLIWSNIAKQENTKTSFLFSHPSISLLTPTSLEV